MRRTVDMARHVLITKFMDDNYEDEHRKRRRIKLVVDALGYLFYSQK